MKRDNKWSRKSVKGKPVKYREKRWRKRDGVAGDGREGGDTEILMIVLQG